MIGGDGICGIKEGKLICEQVFFGGRKGVCDAEDEVVELGESAQVGVVVG